MKTVLAGAVVSAVVAAGVVAGYHFTLGPGGGLEREFHRFRAEVRSTPAPAPGSVASPAGEAEIAHLRAMLAEIRTRDAHDREVENMRRTIKQAGVALAQDLEDRVAELGVALLGKMRDASRDQATARTEEERSVAGQRIDVLKSEFETDVRALIPEADADRLLLAFPPKPFGRRAVPLPATPGGAPMGPGK